METQTIKDAAKDYVDSAKNTARDYMNKAKEFEPEPREDEFTKTVENYTAAVPSTAYLAVALGAMGVSLGLQLMGRREVGNFIAQWVPTWLIIGLYNKVVKLEGHDHEDRLDK
jgi:hypothetical protein